MLSEKIVKAISEQINAEYYSAYLYLTMSAAADLAGFKGTANWLFVQAQEEMAHGTHMFEYLLACDAQPSFAQIAAPPESSSDINEIFKEILAHEKNVTARISAIATLAMQEFDHASYQFIMWYVNEQVEEEDSVRDILDKLRLVDGDKSLLLVLDNELGTRVFVNPFPAK